MKKLKIEDLEREYNEVKKAYAARAEKITELEKCIADLEGRAKEAAIDDDLDTFKKIKQEIEFQGYQLEALKAKQESEKTPTLSIEKVKEAWTNSEDVRSSRVIKLQEELKETRKKLYDVMAEIIECQNDGMKKRNACAIYAGLKPAVFNFQLGADEVIELNKVFPMKYIDLGYKTDFSVIKEFEYLEDIGMLTKDSNQRQHRSTVLIRHYPAPVIM